MIIAVDFDGTLCKHEYPDIGEPNTPLIRSLINVRQYGKAKLILWTCRRDKHLQEAVDWCKEQGLEFDAVNENLPEVIASFGGDTRKVVADIYLDDKAEKIEF
jgi:hypothetical protein